MTNKPDSTVTHATHIEQISSRFTKETDINRAIQYLNLFCGEMCGVGLEVVRFIPLTSKVKGVKVIRDITFGWVSYPRRVLTI